MFTIQTIGCTYCPLFCQDPKNRLDYLIEQTNSHFVIIHSKTKDLFDKDITTINLNYILNNNLQKLNYQNLNELTNVLVTSETITYVIFTSGSTGKPKAVNFE